MSHQTRAHAHGGLLQIYGDDDFEPFEVEVQGIPCVISWSGCVCTHAINPPGSLFWSDTGFRSFGLPTDDPQEVADAIGAYINAPEKHGGCGGKLARWWPFYVIQWRQERGFELEITPERGREGVWGQWGPERRAECWRKHDARQQAALEQMAADGIEPADAGPPRGFCGSWAA